MSDDEEGSGSGSKVRCFSVVTQKKCCFNHAFVLYLGLREKEHFRHDVHCVRPEVLKLIGVRGAI